ncbi:MAG: iron ABC transporter permease [Proteobacteria bacterium]|nr:iron ABC transporter permease [Pseudomonadota bacterium]
MLGSINHRIWTAPLSVAYVALLALPVVFMAISAFGIDSASLSHLIDNNLRAYIVDTAVLLPGVALLTCTIGVGAAWLTTAYNFPGRRILTILLAAPLCIPPFIHGFVYHELFGVGGTLYRLVAEPLGVNPGSWPSMRSTWGATIVFSVSLYPYVYLPVRMVFLNVIRRYRTVAATLCAGEGAFFTRIALPLAGAATLSGTGLVWMDVISDYGLVEYFGVSTMSIGILRAWYGLGDLNLAALLSMISLAGVAILLVFMHWLKGRLARPGQFSTQMEFTPPPKLPRGVGLCASVACAGVAALVFAVPLVQLLVWTLAGWSDIDAQRLAEVGLNTIVLSLSAALVILIATFALCYCGRIENSPGWKRFYRQIRAWLSFSYALPGVVVAIGVIATLEAASGWLGLERHNLFTVVFGLIPVLLACQLRFSAVAVSTLDPAFEQIPRATDDTARTLGCGGLALARRVFIPIMTNPVRTVFILLTINMFKELPMTSFLRPINFDTLAVDSFSKILDERPMQAAPGALIIVLFSLVLFGLLLRVFALNVRDNPN